MKRQEAVITGLGVIGPSGIGRAPLEAALGAGLPLASPIDRSAGYHQTGSSCLAALVPGLDVVRFLPQAEARRLSVPSRFAVVAARMALQDAGIDGVGGRRVAVVLATAFGALLFTEKLVRQILEEGPESAQPFYFSECVANAAAARVAIALGARGANVTITQREAGPLLALSRGAQEVREGRADLAIVGSAEEMTPLLHALLDRFRSTARAGSHGAEAARPFGAGRDGVLAGEGASVCVIEREDDARFRDARILARVSATGAAFDATATVSDWGEGHEALGRALRAAVARSGAGIEEIDRIVSGASGARRGDRLESATLVSAWGGAMLPPVVTPKAVVGEYGGGLLAAAVLATEGAAFGRVTTIAPQDPALAVAPHDGSPLAAPRRVLITSLAAGGAAAWALLERP